MFCSKFRILIIFQNIILMSIFSFQFLQDSSYFCSAILNVQYLSHSFLTSIYIILLFRCFPELRPLSASIIGLYLIAMDVFSDLVVVFFFIMEANYLFAVLQLLFVITGQIVGATADAFGDQKDILSVADKVMAATGFGSV